jgi:hypothetical protein
MHFHPSPHVDASLSLQSLPAQYPSKQRWLLHSLSLLHAEPSASLVFGKMQAARSTDTDVTKASAVFMGIPKEIHDPFPFADERNVADRRAPTCVP